MAMVASLMQGSYTTSTLRPVSWDKGIELKRFGRTVHMFAGTNRFSSLSCEPSFLSAGAAPLQGPKTKSLRISGFKGGVQNEESRDRASGSKLPENSSKCSYLQQGSEETFIEFPKEQEVPLSCGSEDGQMIAGSLTIRKLVKNWLTLFTTRSQNQAADGSLKEPDLGKELLLQNGSQKIERAFLFTWQLMWFTELKYRTS
ncbi:uncharacterized protein LOC127791088 isoform X2 [Diospyros lotus]|uniref:uncharacterized protein LOC127791088 isoform X2 n=1 Tax=Diospyros lotus TaxID=55363 RepID=UPI002253B73C|nr:uncharacterized protein LOC127791088 isoform X2 [Diospyros lotus]